MDPYKEFQDQTAHLRPQTESNYLVLGWAIVVAAKTVAESIKTLAGPINRASMPSWLKGG